MITRMDTGEFFSIEFVTANLATGEGGKLLAYTDATKLSNNVPDYVGAENKRSGRRYRKPRILNEIVKLHLPLEPKQQNRIRSVHLQLITKFNGLSVI